MKKTFFLGVIMLFSSQDMLTQTGNLQWSSQFGGTESHDCAALDIDPFGNVITGGFFNGFADFNPGPGSAVLTSAGAKDAYVAKLNSDGAYLWAVRFGGVGDDVVLDLATDNMGNIVCIGTYRDEATLDFGGSSVVLPGYFNITSTFLAKISIDGDLIWAFSVRSNTINSYVSGTEVFIDDSNRITIAGTTGIGVGWEAADFDPGEDVTSLGTGYPMFIATYFEDGSLETVFGLEGWNWMDCAITDIQRDNESNIFFSGYHLGMIDFNPGAGDFEIDGGASVNAFICKWNPDGSFVWCDNWSSGSGVWGTCLDIDEYGSLYLGGFYNSTTDFDPDLINIYNLVNTTTTPNPFLVKLNSDGSFIYAKAMAGGIMSVLTSIDHDAEDNIYVVGYFDGTADLNPGDDQQLAYSAGNADMFMTKLDADGGHEYSFSMGYTGWDILSRVVYDHTSNSFVIAGSFAQTIDVDPSANTVNHTSGGSSDAIVLKFAECQPSNSEFSASVCDSYTWNDQTYFESGNYVQSFSNIAGCDSTVTLHLTIANATSNNLIVSSCYTYGIANEEFFESGEYVVTLENSQGCDSTIYLNLTIIPYPSIQLSIDDNMVTCTTDGESIQWIDCVQNNNPIEGAMGETYSPTASGIYGVNVTGDGCVSQDCIEFTYIGIEPLAGRGYSLFPNPVDDYLTLRFVSVLPDKAVLFSSDGRLIRDIKILSNQQSLNMDDLSGGVYTIKLVYPDGSVISEKFTVR